MPGEPARKYATYADVLAQPEHVVAEVIGGVLHTMPRPRLRHAYAASALDGEIGGPFHRGRGGPGGWFILIEPELHLGDEPAIVVPDLAGWRRERMPQLPDEPYATLAPDWLCEILSPSTEDYDRAEKIPLYAAQRVSQVWLVDPDVRTLEVLRLDAETYRLIRTWRGDARVRAEPFDAIELDLSDLWAR
jgi:Uma2 family endonuclease